MNILKTICVLSVPGLLRGLSIRPFENHPIVVVGIPGSGHFQIARSLAGLLGRTFVVAAEYHARSMDEELSFVIERLYRAEENGERLVVVVNALTADEQARIRAAVPVTFVGVTFDEQSLRARSRVITAPSIVKPALELLLSNVVIAATIPAIFCAVCYWLLSLVTPPESWPYFRWFLVYLLLVLWGCFGSLIYLYLEMSYKPNATIKKSPLELFTPKQSPPVDMTRFVNQSLLRFHLPRGENSFHVNGAFGAMIASRMLVSQALRKATRSGGPSK